MSAERPGSNLSSDPLAHLGAVVNDIGRRVANIEDQIDGRKPESTFCLTVVGATADVDGGQTNLWVPWRTAVLLDWVTVSSLQGLGGSRLLSFKRGGSVVHTMTVPGGALLARDAADGLRWGPSDTLQLVIDGPIGLGECVQLWFRGLGGGSLQWSDLIVEGGGG